jgi:hypothetical protein
VFNVVSGTASGVFSGDASVFVSSRVLDCAGAGLIGSKTVDILRQGGHQVVAASPKSGIDSITGEGLKEAMAGTQVVIDLANSPSFEDKAVLRA